MNEEHYQTLGSPPLEPMDIDFRLRTASGALMPGMGFLTCNMRIDNESYRQQFIVLQLQLRITITRQSRYTYTNSRGGNYFPCCTDHQGYHPFQEFNLDTSPNDPTLMRK